MARKAKRGTKRSVQKRKSSNRKLSKRGGCGCGVKPAGTNLDTLTKFQGGGVDTPSFSGLSESKFYPLADYSAGDVSRMGADSNAEYANIFKGGKSRRARVGGKRGSRKLKTAKLETTGGGVFDFASSSMTGNGMLANPIMGSGTTIGSMYALAKINGVPLANEASRS